MSTLLSNLETEASLLSIKNRFEYSTLEESNANIFDSIQTGEFPVCLVLAMDIQDYDREGGSVKSQAEVNVLFLDRVPNSTIDLPVVKIEKDIIAPMRGLARSFINRLDKTDFIEEEGIGSVVHRSVHEALMDAHLYGCWSVFTIKFSEDISTCE